MVTVGLAIFPRDVGFFALPQLGEGHLFGTSPNNAFSEKKIYCPAGPYRLQTVRSLGQSRHANHPRERAFARAAGINDVAQREIPEPYRPPAEPQSDTAHFRAYFRGCVLRFEKHRAG